MIRTYMACSMSNFELQRVTQYAYGLHLFLIFEVFIEFKIEPE